MVTLRYKLKDAEHVQWKSMTRAQAKRTIARWHKDESVMWVEVYDKKGNLIDTTFWSFGI